VPLTPLLDRHEAGDWGVVDAKDRALNEQGLKGAKQKIRSAYALPNGVQIWVVTEADRSSTRVLLPSDY
jgi:hypothetical protein